MRPKFTLANLMLLTVIVALAALSWRHRLQIDEQNAELARHREVQAQTARVRQRELELRAASEQMGPSLEVAARYRLAGLGDSLAPPAPPLTSPALETGITFATPAGYRRAMTRLRNAELKLAREKAILLELERRLK